MAAEMTDARLESPERTVMIIKVLGFRVSFSMVYEDGAWRWEPNAEQTADWGKPIDQWIAAAKASGSYGK